MKKTIISGRQIDKQALKALKGGWGDIGSLWQCYSTVYHYHFSVCSSGHPSSEGCFDHFVQCNNTGMSCLGSGCA